MSDLLSSIATSFFDTLDDLTSSKVVSDENDDLVHIIIKENRYMYITILFIFLILVANIVFFGSSK